LFAGGRRPPSRRKGRTRRIARPVPSRIRVETAKGRTHGVSSTAVDAEGKAGKRHKQGRNGRGGQVVLALSSFLLVKEAFPGRATGRLQQECMRFLSPSLHRSLSPPIPTLFSTFSTSYSSLTPSRVLLRPPSPFLRRLGRLKRCQTRQVASKGYKESLHLASALSQASVVRGMRLLGGLSSSS
jgi:hypothetical protein